MLGPLLEQEVQVDVGLTGTDQDGVCDTVETEIASFVYDGDGNRVQSTIGSTTTTFVGNYYEVSGSNVTKYYYAGSQRIAMRACTDTSCAASTLSYLFADQLGSTSVTVNADNGAPSQALSAIARNPLCDDYSNIMTCHAARRELFIRRAACLSRPAASASQKHDECSNKARSSQPGLRFHPIYRLRPACSFNSSTQP